MFVSLLTFKHLFIMKTISINDKINLRSNLVNYYTRSLGDATKAALKVNEIFKNK